MSNDANVHTVEPRCTSTSWSIAAGSKRLPNKWNRCSKFAPTFAPMICPKSKTINAVHTMKSCRSIVARASVAFVISVHYGVVHIQAIHSSNLVSGFQFFGCDFPPPLFSCVFIGVFFLFCCCFFCYSVLSMLIFDHFGLVHPSDK